jgi:hypothetical protein
VLKLYPSSTTSECGGEVIYMIFDLGEVWKRLFVEQKTCVISCSYIVFFVCLFVMVLTDLSDLCMPNMIKKSISERERERECTVLKPGMESVSLDRKVMLCL